MILVNSGVVTTVLLALLLFGQSAEVQADIYRYRDENGVWHFTNIRSDVRYKLYIRSYPGKAVQQYIRDFEGIISQASERFKVDPFLIKAVIKAESDFNQLMPGTAEDMKVEDPFNPEENIFGGTRYLSMMLSRFNNDMRLALAAYNAGPERVENHRGIPPIPETKSFIEKVMQYYGRYRAGTQR
jgi:soluble lytic murein transglycosylase